ncbi:MAG TPA: hypothetical protein VHD31_03405 [Candidatus Paceibacterota bacterium]|nr:hypothetical protein [Candidatus Paceibacterota bacterium]
MGQNIPDFTLDHPEVRKAREAYERRFRKGTKVHGLFDTLFFLYRGVFSFVEIAQKMHVSVRYIENLYLLFKPFCDNRSGMERRLHVAAIKRNRRKQAAEQGPNQREYVLTLKNRAEKEGFVVRNKTWYSDHAAEWLPMARFFRINWISCVLFYANTQHRVVRGNQAYARYAIFKSSVAKVKFAIFLVLIPDYPVRFFVVPTEQIQKSMFANGEVRTMVNIRLMRKKARGGTAPRIDILQYEDAWHLLKDPVAQEKTPT